MVIIERDHVHSDLVVVRKGQFVKIVLEIQVHDILVGIAQLLILPALEFIRDQVGDLPQPVQVEENRTIALKVVTLRNKK